MRENIEQFPNTFSLGSTEKSKSISKEQRPEKKDLFIEAVDRIKTNQIAVKLLNLMEKGYLPSKESLPSINVQQLVVDLRKNYPTIDDIEHDLTEIVDKEIVVAYQKDWTQEQYQQAIQEKKAQYKREAVGEIVNALAPVYEKFGPLLSEENRVRIMNNLTSMIEKLDPKNISSKQRDYLKKNILAAASYNLSPDEARRIIQIQQAFFEIWQQAFPGSQQDANLKNAIQKIKEKSGLALEEIREQLGIPLKESLPERFELKQEKIEIEYPGMPIDIYLADKHLQIIGVREDQRWNADYLLIDPAIFDQMNPTTGYKGIRENESFTLGRNNPLRFEFPDTVSRSHLKIELKNGKLSIEDLGSTNGTVLQVEKPKRLNREQIESIESSPEKERAISEFGEYVEKHQAEIERELQRGRDLEEIFYHEFYNKKIDELEYNPDDPKVQELEKTYTAQVAKVRENLLRESQSEYGLMRLMLIDNGYWLYCNVNGGLRNQTALGRLYFNLKPEYVAQFFSQVIYTFRNKGLHIQTKIPLKGNAMMFNRFDKMVVYFDAEEEKEVLQIIENLYHNDPKIFDKTGIPRFTAEVRDENGEIMTGIGFGEEPIFRNESFGTIRSKILASVYLDAKYSGLSVIDPRFDFESSFRRACIKYQVNPQNPAFNLSRVSELPELKREIAA